MDNHNPSTQKIIECSRCSAPRVVGKRAKGGMCRKCIGISNSVKFQGHKVSPETRAKLHIAHKGRRLSPERQEKLRRALIGRPVSDATRLKLSKSHKARQAFPFKIKTVVYRICFPKRVARYWLGKPRSPETKAKVKATKIAKGDSVGRKNPMYVDGGTPIICGQCGGAFKVPTSTVNRRRFCSRGCRGNWMSANLRVNPPKIRAVREYRWWRDAVLKRDGYTCQMCGANKEMDKTVVLHADHIKPVIAHPELVYDTDNGRCLCRSCHYSLPTHGGKGRRWPKPVAA